MPNETLRPQKTEYLLGQTLIFNAASGGEYDRQRLNKIDMARLRLGV